MARADSPFSFKRIDWEAVEGGSTRSIRQPWTTPATPQLLPQHAWYRTTRRRNNARLYEAVNELSNGLGWGIPLLSRRRRGGSFNYRLFGVLNKPPRPLH